MGRPAKDWSNQTVGNLLVLYREGTSADGHALWKCECQCDKKTIVYKTSNQLTKGSKFLSCGCLINEANKQARLNQYNKTLLNKRFGKLVVKECLGSNNKGALLWRCTCDCGNLNFVTTTHHLTSGNTKSCGCLSSVGELNIQNILINNQILFIKEKSFDDLHYNNDINSHPRFDFYLPELNRLIEFDGSQHYNQTNLNWEDQISLQDRQQRDQLKNQWAAAHNIPLVRIPYWEKDNITLEMLLGDKYLVG